MQVNWSNHKHFPPSIECFPQQNSESPSYALVKEIHLVPRFSHSPNSVSWQGTKVSICTPEITSNVPPYPLEWESLTDQPHLSFLWTCSGVSVPWLKKLNLNEFEVSLTKGAWVEFHSSYCCHHSKYIYLCYTVFNGILLENSSRIF